jgi:hypothetical protein
MTMTDDCALDVGWAVHEALTDCLDSGMQLPFICCLLSVNGSVYALRFNGLDKEPDELANDAENRVCKLPAMIVILDQAG